MKESAYKRISETRIKLASLICEQINGNYSDEVKGKLISILANIGINNVFSLILEYVSNHLDNTDAIIAISKFDRKESIDFLLEKLSNPRTPHREVIVECIGNLKKPDLIASLKPYLADEDRQVRFQTAYALYNIGGKEAALAMTEYISDRDEWISMTILRLLCQMKELDTIPILINKYHSDTDLRRKALMISFLARFKSITLLGAFDDALRARDARLRANAIEAIGNLKLPEEELKKRVVPFLHDPNNRIRANAILAMAKIAPEKVKSQIIEMVDSDDVQLRRSAAFILSVIPPIDFLSQAEKLIADTNDSVKKRMIQSLKNFPHEFISANINKVLSDPNKWIRKYAVDMIAGIPAFEVTPIIKLLKNEHSAPNITACLNFLASHPSSEAESALRLHYKDKRINVVNSLLKAILAIYGMDGIMSISPKLEQHDPFVVQAITETALEGGNIQVLESIVTKLSKTKNQKQMELLLPSVETLVNTLLLGDKMPCELLKAFTVPEPVAKPVIKSKTSHQKSPVSETAQKQTTATNTAVQNLDLSFNLDGSIPQLSEGVPNLTLPSLDGIDLMDMNTTPVKKKPVAPHFKSGLKAYNLGKYKKAIEEFNKSVSEGEETPNIIDMYMGIIFFEEENYVDAVKHLEAFVKKVPNNSKAMYLLGKCYKKKKNHEKVIDTYQHFIQGELDASDSMKRKIWKDMGTACAITGKCETAIRLLTSIYKLEKNNPEIPYYLAMALYKIKKISEAATILEQAKKVAPEGKSITKQIEALSQAVRSGIPI